MGLRTEIVELLSAKLVFNALQDSVVRIYVLTLLFYGCVEPFDAEFEDFESAIVIEATITNEQKLQTIYITRAFRFEDDGPMSESNANVRVTGDDDTVYDFIEMESGVYVSEIEFSAKPGVNYQLLVETSDGSSYGSNEMSISSVATLDAVRAERIRNDADEDGIAIFVDSYDPTGSSLNYRYTYEETYKIIAPSWSPNDLVVDPEVACGVSVVPKQREQRVCYNTELSNNLVLTSTSDLAEDRVDNFMVRFLNRDNLIISHRYSILVKQFVQSNTAFSYFTTLSEFSGNESLFSETQPGFLEGNLFSVQNRNEKVLGFFDVASVSEKRIFIDYEDFYPGEPLPPFPNPCTLVAPPLRTLGGACLLSGFVERGSISYFGDNAEPEYGEGPYWVVSRICGDCTVLGKIEVPDFWVE